MDIDKGPRRNADSMKAPPPAMLAAAANLPPEQLALLPPALRELARKAAMARLSPDDQRKAGILGYLHDQRELRAQRLAEGNNPYGYLPTIEGNITAGILSWSDLDIDELKWVLDEQAEYHRKAAAFPGGDAKGLRESQAAIDGALAALQAKGGTWSEAPAPIADDPNIPPSPPHDPSRER